MRTLSFFTLLSVALTFVAASDVHNNPLARRHHQLAKKQPELKRRSNSARCKPRSTSLAATSTPAPKPTANEAIVKADKADPTTSSSSKTPKPTKSAASNSLIAVTDWSCGDSGATKSVQSESGPNGNIDWLNCGINSGGWTPPYITVGDVKAASLDSALSDPSSPFHTCSDYIDLFNKYGGEFGLPPILIASISMQESTCNPNTVGGAGEQGLMQLTKDKCGAAPGGNCKDPDYNVRTGSKYFADTLAANNGDLLHTIGGYNGWPQKMTFGSATAMAKTSCCRCQNNLDYLHQTLNGWMQNVDPYKNHIGKYFNLDQC